MSGTTEREKKIMAFVNGAFGWHGGIGDPPEDDTVLAIVRGTLGYLEQEPQGDGHG